MNRNEILKANAILDAREERVNIIEEFIEKHKNTIIAARVNYPGNDKENYISTYVIEKGKNELIKAFDGSILEILEKTSAEGPYILMAVDRQINLVKKITIELENNHPLGRFLDLDVYGNDIRSVSREELGFEKRKCYICNNYAHQCIRSRNHTVEDVEKFIVETVKEYMENLDEK